MNIVLPYVGSKKRIISLIEPNIPSHDTYIEPFAGGFSLGLNLIEAGVVNKAVLNDLDEDVVSFWTYMRDDYWSLITEISNLVSIHNTLISTHSREEVKRKLLESGVSDVSKVALFYLFRKMSRGTSIEYVSDTLDVSINTNSLFLEVSNLLKTNVPNILNKSYIDLTEYNTDKNFWYFDPPYTSANNKTYYSVCKEDVFKHEELARFIQGLKGKFILSYDNTDFVYDLYKKYNIYEIRVPSTQNRLGYSNEVLVSNMELKLEDIYKEKHLVDCDFDIQEPFILEDL